MLSDIILKFYKLISRQFGAMDNILKTLEFVKSMYVIGKITHFPGFILFKM
jgi:hypothetical protein